MSEGISKSGGNVQKYQIEKCTRHDKITNQWRLRGGINESFQLRAVFGGNEVCTADVGPANIIGPIIFLLDLQKIDRRVQVARLNLVASRNE